MKELAMFKNKIHLAFDLVYTIRPASTDEFALKEAKKLCRIYTRPELVRFWRRYGKRYEDAKRKN